MAKIMDVTTGFHMRIKSLYDTEKQLEIALLAMAENATSKELVKGLREHLEETKEHSSRLEQIFSMLQVAPEKHPGASIRGLIADGRKMTTIDASHTIKDALIAGAGREVEHYEMACYMNAIDEAKAIGLTDAVTLLETTLAEEVTAGEALDMVIKACLKQTVDERG